MDNETCPVCAETGEANPGIILEQQQWNNDDIGGFGADPIAVVIPRLPHVTRRYGCSQRHRWVRKFFHVNMVWELDADSSLFGRIESCEQSLVTEVSVPG